MAFRKLSATESRSCYRPFWFQRYERVAWGLPCVFILNWSKRTLNAVPRWFEMNANVVCEVSLSVPLLCCPQQVLPVVQLRRLRVTDLTSENSSLVWLTLILIYFLPYESLVCESWSSVLTGLLLHFRSFHLAVESAGNPASIIRGKNVEVIVVVVWSETDIMTWAWNFKISSIYRSCFTGVLLENEIVSFFPHWSSRLSKSTAMLEGFWYTFSFEKFSVALSQICTRILAFWSSFYRFCMHSGTQDCSKTLCGSSCFSSICSLVD